jgi:hypothetical protein
MNSHPPGLHPSRLSALMHGAIRRCRLDLSGAVVLTEAATGAYVVTPLIAAIAGAEQVYAVTRATRYGTVEQVATWTSGLAALLGVQDRIQVITDKSRDMVAQADIITNSGHVRPIDAPMIGFMKPTAVIPLMYEAWEFRPSDIDLAACRRRGIPVAGTNERHPTVDVFSFLGVMALKLLLDASVAVYSTRILLLCDNAFGPFLERTLSGAGAEVDMVPGLPTSCSRGYDVLLVALEPTPKPVLTAGDAERIADTWPGAVVVQFWGDIDRAALAAHNVPVWPVEPPSPGHMGILPSAVGPEPVVRLQTGGLKVGEILWRRRLDTALRADDGVVAAAVSWGADDVSGLGMEL